MHYKIYWGRSDKRDYKINFNKINKFIDHKMVSVSDGVDEIIECINKKI